MSHPKIEFGGGRCRSTPKGKISEEQKGAFANLFDWRRPKAATSGMRPVFTGYVKPRAPGAAKAMVGTKAPRTNGSISVITISGGRRTLNTRSTKSMRHRCGKRRCLQAQALAICSEEGEQQKLAFETGRGLLPARNQTHVVALISNFSLFAATRHRTADLRRLRHGVCILFFRDVCSPAMQVEQSWGALPEAAHPLSRRLHADTSGPCASASLAWPPGALLVQNLFFFKAWPRRMGGTGAFLRAMLEEGPFSPYSRS